MWFNRFYDSNFFLVSIYVKDTCLIVTNNRQKNVTLKWIRSIITGYYLYIAYYGLFKLDFNRISHPNWRNLKNHWWKCITVWNIVCNFISFVCFIYEGLY